MLVVLTNCFLEQRDNPLQPDPATVNASTAEGIEDSTALAPMVRLSLVC